MARFMKFDNCKKLSKITKLSKRLIKMIDNGKYAVGYGFSLRGHDLVIADDCDNSCKPFVSMKRFSFATGCFIGVWKWNGSKHETTWYTIDHQAEAFLDALSWMNRVS